LLRILLPIWLMADTAADIDRHFADGTAEKAADMAHGFAEDSAADSAETASPDLATSCVRDRSSLRH
jgi:hypothetical protein